jgi:hypothetical protein
MMRLGFGFCLHIDGFRALKGDRTAHFGAATGVILGGIYPCVTGLVAQRE